MRKECINMITLSILVFVALVIAAILGLVGAGVFVIFGDVIVCGVIIYGLVVLVKWLKNRVKPS
jgi:hypothetical protein